MTKIFADKNWEYKFIHEESITVQKLLNQWKHEFELCIIHCEFSDGYIKVLLTRRRIS